ncbi:hypothetical protein IW140_000162 [Coemansia sp. RSA 1813]|nr:hypothetical protein EV178_000031 [Coemansia sp. RSA 1646]KAJ1772328.1 hypothetical protein LPJ74_001593 [Coemansia sp. RSA 1843]KAJ2093267.1 hypothetical protein IW138_000560 [Coemansia sp. RSA 986]KAJ2213042.1 hypothetical protein EV179_004190 [Coemansia sp. RSA 487]KAJ2573520.1 hypothetical protein IW140_000162 [Coemansia sp. RSA 1813]
MSASNSRIERFINNLRQNLTDGNYYEGHQELRAIAIRLVKQKKHSRAIQLLYLGALELCQYNQWGSVADLASFMINIYVEEKLPVTDDNKERVYDILEKLSQATEYYPRVYEAAIQWTVKEQGDGIGDSQMHHFIGCIQRNKARYQEAEQHFLVGTSESPHALGLMLFDWAARTSPQYDYGLFAARGVLKYLAIGWYEAACLCWKAFAAKLFQALPDEVEQRTGDKSVQSKFGPVYYCSTHVLFNFTQLLLLTIERADEKPESSTKRVFSQIRDNYAPSFGENEQVINDLLDSVGEKYFGIVIQRQQSLFDIVNSLFASPSQPQIQNTSTEAMD